MVIPFQCSSCRQPLTVDEAHAGMQVVCIRCGARLVAPPPMHVNPTSGYGGSPHNPRWNPAVRRKNNSLFWAVLGAAGGASAIAVIAVAIWLFSVGSSDESAGNGAQNRDVDVDRVTAGASGGGRRGDGGDGDDSTTETRSSTNLAQSNRSQSVNEKRGEQKASGTSAPIEVSNPRFVRSVAMDGKPLLCLLVDYQFKEGAADPEKSYELFSQFDIRRPDGVQASFSQRNGNRGLTSARGTLRIEGFHSNALPERCTCTVRVRGRQVSNEVSTTPPNGIDDLPEDPVIIKLREIAAKQQLVLANPQADVQQKCYLVDYEFQNGGPDPDVIYYFYHRPPFGVSAGSHGGQGSAYPVSDMKAKGTWRHESMMFALEKSHPQDFHVMIALREHPNIRVAAAKRITWTPPKSDP